MQLEIKENGPREKSRESLWEMFNIVYFENTCFLECNIAERQGCDSLPYSQPPSLSSLLCNLILVTGFLSCYLCPSPLGDQSKLLISKTRTLTLSGS